MSKVPQIQPASGSKSKPTPIKMAVALKSWIQRHINQRQIENTVGDVRALGMRWWKDCPTDACQALGHVRVQHSTFNFEVDSHTLARDSCGTGLKWPVYMQHLRRVFLLPFPPSSFLMGFISRVHAHVFLSSHSTHNLKLQVICAVGFRLSFDFDHGVLPAPEMLFFIASAENHRNFAPPQAGALSCHSILPLPSVVSTALKASVFTNGT